MRPITNEEEMLVELQMLKSMRTELEQDLYALLHKVKDCNDSIGEQLSKMGLLSPDLTYSRLYVPFSEHVIDSEINRYIELHKDKFIHNELS